MSALSETAYAGFWRRFTAALLDQIVLAVMRGFIYGILGLILYASLYFLDVRDHHYLIYAVFGAFIFLLNIWITWVYFALMESSGMQGTLGKLALGIRVFHKEGNRALTFEEATVRYFAKILSRMTFLIGYILCAFSSKKQALHDFVGRSVLIVSR